MIRIVNKDGVSLLNIEDNVKKQISQTLDSGVNSTIINIFKKYPILDDQKWIGQFIIKDRWVLSPTPWLQMSLELDLTEEEKADINVEKSDDIRIITKDKVKLLVLSDSQKKIISQVLNNQNDGSNVSVLIKEFPILNDEKWTNENGFKLSATPWLQMSLELDLTEEEKADTNAENSDDIRIIKKDKIKLLELTNMQKKIISLALANNINEDLLFKEFPILDDNQWVNASYNNENLQLSATPWLQLSLELDLTGEEDDNNLEDNDNFCLVTKNDIELLALTNIQKELISKTLNSENADSYWDLLCQDFSILENENFVSVTLENGKYVVEANFRLNMSLISDLTNSKVIESKVDKNRDRDVKMHLGFKETTQGIEFGKSW